MAKEFRIEANGDSECLDIIAGTSKKQKDIAVENSDSNNNFMQNTLYNSNTNKTTKEKSVCMVDG